MKSTPEPANYHIDALGAQGDGVAAVDGGPLFIPFALPGETVTASRNGARADLISVLEPSPRRVEPACSHFGVCGGCALQHLDHPAYLAWKRKKLVDALRSKGIEIAVDDIVSCQPQSRRRVMLSARRTDAGMLLGYRRAMSHEIVAIAECPVTRPEIVTALDTLRELSGIVCNTREVFHLTVTHTASGLDVAASGCGKPDDTIRLKTSAFAVRAGLARVAVDGEIIIEPQKPVVLFGKTAVAFPPGGFLQAVAETETVMAELVVAHLAKSKKVADLFAGAGAFALRLARHAEIHAVESDAAALAALDNGFRFAKSLKKVTVEKRDLDRRPLTFKEFRMFDGLVFDPPRAGAENQAKQIARSDVRRVAAVSCNPVTLARDVALLVEGGYALKRVTPIDQFLWSPHVEAVALLEKTVPYKLRR